MVSTAATTAIAVCGGWAGLCLLSWLYTSATAPGFHVAGKHVIITGGSSGLGLALAKQYARAGAKVTIVARNADKLAAAKREIESSRRSDVKSHPVLTCACDVSDFDAVFNAVQHANTFHGRVTDHVILNAGICMPGLLLEQDLHSFHKAMDTNFFGALHLVKAALPAMVASPLPASEKMKRRIVFVNAEGGLASVAGYSEYSSTKYAVRGLSDALRNELKLYDIETSVYYPGDMDSPLLADEQAFKPEVTKLLVVPGNAMSVDAAAKVLIRGISRGHYAITNELILQVLRALANGVAPRVNTPLELVLMPVLVVVQTLYLWYFDHIVVKHGKNHRSQ